MPFTITTFRVKKQIRKIRRFSWFAKYWFAKYKNNFSDEFAQSNAEGI